MAQKALILVILFQQTSSIDKEKLIGFHSKITLKIIVSFPLTSNRSLLGIYVYLSNNARQYSNPETMDYTRTLSSCHMI